MSGRVVVVALCVLALVWLYAHGQVPPLPAQQPLVIRHTNLATNVIVSVTTIISEIPGVLVDGRFVALRTNLMFRTSSNVWASP